MTLKQAFKEFIFQKELAGLAPASLDDYRNIIGIMLNHIGETTDLDSVSYDLVAEYIMALLHRPLARATISTYIRNTRIFLRWVHGEYGLPFDPVKIKVPKSPKRVVHIYSDTEIQYLFSCVQTSIPWLTARNRAIIALMLDSGIRQCEVCKLLKKNVDSERMVLKVQGKGSKERLVPLGYMSHILLDDYFSSCPFKDVENVFLDRLGEPVSGNAIRLFVNRLKKQLPFDLSSHKLRHNFATNYCIDNIRKTGNTNVYDLSILMGHESIETTKKYEHFAHEIIAVENSISHLDKVYKV
ncbi:MAG: tyrosine-type recombinase/integrase [Clostridium sp.]|nr:tyrosine-type recombinase/integrase [Clostridium sp.]